MAEAYAGRNANSSAGKLHRDPTCPFIGRDPRPVDPERWLRREWCRHCAREGERPSTESRGHFESLQRAAGGDA